jgi:hypothetical protein
VALACAARLRGAKNRKQVASCRRLLQRRPSTGCCSVPKSQAMPIASKCVNLVIFGISKSLGELRAQGR